MQEILASIWLQALNWPGIGEASVFRENEKANNSPLKGVLLRSPDIPPGVQFADYLTVLFDNSLIKLIRPERLQDGSFREWPLATESLREADSFIVAVILQTAADAFANGQAAPGQRKRP